MIDPEIGQRWIVPKYGKMLLASMVKGDLFNWVNEETGFVTSLEKFNRLSKFYSSAEPCDHLVSPSGKAMLMGSVLVHPSLDPTLVREDGTQTKLGGWYDLYHGQSRVLYMGNKPRMAKHLAESVDIVRGHRYSAIVARKESQSLGTTLTEVKSIFDEKLAHYCFDCDDTAAILRLKGATVWEC